MHAVGLDIGGANLKAADSRGAAHSEVFEIWRAPHELPSKLEALLARFARFDRLAVTMTAELADCFETKREGVNFILSAVEAAAGRAPIAVWLTSGRFVTASAARDEPLRAAASNWQALATWAGRWLPPGATILVDVGSTTTDVIPFRDQVPCPLGTTDVGRLVAGELVYTGVRRTPVCAVTRQVPIGAAMCPLAAEWFATMLDVYLVAGKIPEDPSDCATANGRPATIHAARDRLARAVCCDRTELSVAAIDAMAEYLAECQAAEIASAIDAVVARGDGALTGAIVSGSGEFLARSVLRRHPAMTNRPIISLSERLSSSIAEAACAYALAILATEGRHG